MLSLVLTVCARQSLCAAQDIQGTNQSKLPAMVKSLQDGKFWAGQQQGQLEQVTLWSDKFVPANKLTALGELLVGSPSGTPGVSVTETGARWWHWWAVAVIMVQNVGEQTANVQVVFGYPSGQVFYPGQPRFNLMTDGSNTPPIPYSSPSTQTGMDGFSVPVPPGDVRQIISIGRSLEIPPIEGTQYPELLEIARITQFNGIVGGYFKTGTMSVPPVVFAVASDRPVIAKRGSLASSMFMPVHPEQEMGNGNFGVPFGILMPP